MISYPSFLQLKISRRVIIMFVLHKTKAISAILSFKFFSSAVSTTTTPFLRSLPLLSKLIVAAELFKSHQKQWPILSKKRRKIWTSEGLLHAKAKIGRKIGTTAKHSRLATLFFGSKERLSPFQLLLRRSPHHELPLSRTVMSLQPRPSELPIESDLHHTQNRERMSTAAAAASQIVRRIDFEKGLCRANIVQFERKKIPVSDSLSKGHWLSSSYHGSNSGGCGGDTPADDDDDDGGVTTTTTTTAISIRLNEPKLSTEQGILSWVCGDCEWRPFSFKTNIAAAVASSTFRTRRRLWRR